MLTMALAPILLLAYPFGSAVGYTVGFGPHGIVAADLNGDGKLDLASANAEDGTVSVLIGNGDGTYLPMQITRSAPDPSSSRRGTSIEMEKSISSPRMRSAAVLLCFRAKGMARSAPGSRRPLAASVRMQ